MPVGQIGYYTLVSRRSLTLDIFELAPVLRSSEVAVNSTPVSSGNVVSVLLQYLVHAQVTQNTFHFVAAGAGQPPALTVAQVLTAFEKQYWQESAGGAGDGLADYLSDQVGSCTLFGTVVFGVNSRSIAEPYSLSPFGGTDDTGPSLPSGASIVLKRKGTRAGRAYQGRIYLGGVAANRLNFSRLVGPDLVDFQRITDRLSVPLEFGAAPNTMTLRQCLYKSGNAPLDGAIGLTYSVNDVVRYQRRREIGVGV